MARSANGPACVTSRGTGARSRRERTARGEPSKTYEQNYVNLIAPVGTGVSLDVMAPRILGWIPSLLCLTSIFLAAPELAGCGGGVANPERPAESSASGGNPASGGAGGSGGGSGGGGGVGDTCTGFDESPAVATPTLQISNNRAEPINLLACSPRYDVVVDGAPQAAELADWYMQTCADLVASGEQACCGCELPGATLATGESIDLVWSGKGYQVAVMPESCYPEPPNGASKLDCYRGTPLPAGPVDIILHLTTTSGTEDLTQTFVLGTDPTFAFVVD